MSSILPKTERKSSALTYFFGSFFGRIKDSNFEINWIVCVIIEYLYWPHTASDSLISMYFCLFLVIHLEQSQHSCQIINTDQLSGSFKAVILAVVKQSPSIHQAVDRAVVRQFYICSQTVVYLSVASSCSISVVRQL